MNTGDFYGMGRNELLPLASKRLEEVESPSLIFEGKQGGQSDEPPKPIRGGLDSVHDF